MSDRYDRAAAGFTQRVEGAPAGAWDRRAPCEGWVARDVVRHLTEWVPGFFELLPAKTSVEDDPVAAWHELDATLRSTADSDHELDHPYVGKHKLGDAVNQFVVGDLLVHTWDLARATGQDERLDPELVHDMLGGLQAMGDALRVGGQFGPPVEVPADADEQTQLIAYTGRTP